MNRFSLGLTSKGDSSGLFKSDGHSRGRLEKGVKGSWPHTQAVFEEGDTCWGRVLAGLDQSREQSKGLLSRCVGERSQEGGVLQESSKETQETCIHDELAGPEGVGLGKKRYMCHPQAEKIKRGDEGEHETSQVHQVRPETRSWRGPRPAALWRSGRGDG